MFVDCSYNFIVYVLEKAVLVLDTAILPEWRSHVSSKAPRCAPCSLQQRPVRTAQTHLYRTHCF